MLDFAIKVAKKTGDHGLKYFKTSPKIIYKPDHTPVTVADQEAEIIARKLINQKFPTHGIIGEEHGTERERAKYVWTLDPIDGTKSFVRGIDSWGTLVSVLEDGKPIIGVYYSPATKEIFYAQKNKGAFFNGKKIELSKVKKLNESFISYSSVNHFIKWGLVNKVAELADVAQGKRGNADCDGINHLFKGHLDLYISARGSIWDYAAPAIITEEAGGKFTDFNGQFSLTNETAIFSNGLLHNQVLKYLKK